MFTRRKKNITQTTRTNKLIQQGHRIKGAYKNIDCFYILSKSDQ